MWQTALNKWAIQIKQYLTLGFAFFVCLNLWGCGRLLLGDQALNRNPLENPTVNVTNFSSALSCMDELLLNYDTPVITITAQDIPNMTGSGDNIAGTKDMLITSISKLSERSGRIRFVSYGTDLRDIILLHKTHEQREQFVTPDYFIRGAITQLDKNVLSSRIGTASHDDNWNTAFSGGQGVSFAAMDLNIGRVSTLQMIAGATSNNVLAIWDRGAGLDLGGRIKSVGTFFDFGIDKRDGIGQAIRNMTDLAVIEIIGKLLEVPYMTCLPLNHSSPQVLQMIETEYQSYLHNPQKLIRVVQARLKQLKLFHGQANGVMTRETALALEYFHNLYRVGSHTPRPKTIDFQLYYDLMYSRNPMPPPRLYQVSLTPSQVLAQPKQLSFELNPNPTQNSPAKATKKQAQDNNPTNQRPTRYQDIIPLKKDVPQSNQKHEQEQTTSKQASAEQSSSRSKSKKSQDSTHSAAYWEERFTRELNTEGRFKPRSIQEVIQGM